MGNSKSHCKTGFSSSSTAEQVAADALSKRGIENLQDGTAIVTGGYSGIGRETARVLAKHGARVIIAGRNEQQCAQVAKEIADETKNDRVQGMQLDLASLKSVKKFADEFNALNIPLDLLINNAGIMATQKYTETEDGIELQFGVNHMGHFFLTQLLTDRLKQAKIARVVNLSSDLHSNCEVINWENMPPTKDGYDPFKNYGISKAANILFSVELNRRFQENEDTKHITAYSLHPGVIRTNLSRDVPGMSSMMAIASFLLKSVPQGAATTMFCAIHPDAAANAGGYFDNSNVGQAKGAAAIPENAQKLWELSEKLVHEKTALEGKTGN